MNVRSVYVKIKNNVMSDTQDSIELTYEVGLSPEEDPVAVTKAVIQMGRAVIASSGGGTASHTTEEVWEAPKPEKTPFKPKKTTPFGAAAASL